MNLDQIRIDMKEALKAVEEKHNMNFKIGSMGYDDTGFTARLTATKRNEAGQDLRQEADWKKAVDQKRVEDHWRGMKYDNDKYIILGVELNRRKNCIKVQRISDKKIFITSSATVRRILSSQ